MASYIFDNAAEREAARRFSSLGSAHDPHTTRHLVGTEGPLWVDAVEKPID
jgi:hypothetical protein